MSLCKEEHMFLVTWIGGAAWQRAETKEGAEAAVRARFPRLSPESIVRVTPIPWAEYDAGKREGPQPHSACPVHA